MSRMTGSELVEPCRGGTTSVGSSRLGQEYARSLPMHSAYVAVCTPHNTQHNIDLTLNCGEPACTSWRLSLERLSPVLRPAPPRPVPEARLHVVRLSHRGRDLVGKRLDIIPGKRLT